MKKSEKLQIIKWFIRQKCGSEGGGIQTESKSINDLPTLEKLVMQDRSYPHISDCSTCWWEDSDGKRCYTCRDRCNYTFPYGHWKSICGKRGIKFDECK